MQIRQVRLLIFDIHLTMQAHAAKDARAPIQTRTEQPAMHLMHTRHFTPSHVPFHHYAI